MKRNYAQETESRVAWIKSVMAEAGAKGLVFGASGGKDAALTGILCKMACDNTLGIIMPCESTRNYGEDRADALLLAQTFGIEHIEISLTSTKKELLAAIGQPLGRTSSINIAPRLRMATLYAVGAERGALVVGTGNRSEAHMGYFTKWGDGVYDLNPIADLTVTEIFEFLKHLGVPPVFYTKAPSAGLFEGQTDEEEMGVTYTEIDNFLLNGEIGPNFDKIRRFHEISEHKRRPVRKYGG